MASRAADNSYYDDAGFTLVDLTAPVEVSLGDEFASVTVRAAESLKQNHYAVIDSLLHDHEAALLRQEVQAYHTDGRMVDGEIGKGVSASTGGVVRSMRSDKMIWFEGDESFVGDAMRRHVKRMDILIQKIAIFFDAVAPNLTWTGHCRSKIMATVYAGNGARYVPHFDNPNGNGRRMTAILYLNEGWKKEHGGILRLKTASKIVDIAPLFNRLLLFWSDRRCPHEVRPATGPDRYAVTLWYMDKVERDAAEAARKLADAAHDGDER